MEPDADRFGLQFRDFVAEKRCYPLADHAQTNYDSKDGREVHF
jgi:hypothetical protein